MKSTTQLLAWNDYLKTGIDIVDQQHRGLVDLVNETAAKLSVGNDLSVEEMRTLLGFLTDYAATHFSTEEALMAFGGVPERHIVHHRQSHVTFLKQVEAMLGELGGSDALSGHQLMDFLGNWLIYHILGEDRNLSSLLKGEPVAAKGAASAEDDPAAASPAQEIANQSLSRLYAFMTNRNVQLQATEQAQRSQSTQMQEQVAARTAELAASEERFQALFYNGALPCVISRLEQSLMPGLIVDANPAACRLLGYGREELLELSLLDIVAPDETARFPLMVNELLVAGRFECEMSHVTKSGPRITTQVSMMQFVMRGQPVVMSIIRDIPSQRTAELAQQGVQRQAKHLARVRSAYLAGTPVAIGRPVALKNDHAEQTPAQVAAFLAEQPLFRELAPAHQKQLAMASRLRCLQKGDVLFNKGDLPEGLYLVVGGHLMLTVSSPQGTRKVLGIFGFRQSVGEAEVVMDSPYPYSAEAVDVLEVLEVGQAALLAVLDKDCRFARRLMERIGARQHDLVHDVESYTLRSSVERVIGYLLQHAIIDAGGRLKVVLPASKQLIASLLDIKPETLSRTFRDLSEAGLISVKGRNVQIPDVDRLAAYQGGGSGQP